MKKSEIIAYLQGAIREAYDEHQRLNKEYAAATHMERIGMAHSKDKAEDKYYYMWMIGNDLGINVD